MDNAQTQKVPQVPMYYADNHGHLRSKLVPQDYVCQAYETLEMPTNSPYEPVTIANGHVTGVTQEEHEAWQKQQPDYVEPTPPEPTDEQKGLTALAVENAQLKQQLGQLQQAVTAMAQTAPITGGSK
ncbi:hypothetical protein [Furfurilactobacillus milii]|uniref:Uncharacterized protein n=1 Tax=Furfurilactobacillus milii TaxID=2888272 RepID=A0ABT6DCW0_9LACO|nr:hypothetical protein [Furfurilactobacillus milii]QLE67407.1 hypothetical protein LROSL2_2057 [Furfurilactobacillus rossiae]MCF6161915.1 hypothetical protein [Furfurilactobacillus milii]MCF6164295.1 hypothetical protein [Furfurilactobacillus milii]MDF9914977.1 hypothetical protein [Furfurilactobacillus milii]QLE69836.1 hypothetical protein LROSL3_2115 [Furfurilactobacillus rossiae]